MARARSPDRDKAFEIYRSHGGNIDLIEIAKRLNISDGTVRGWKNKDKWDEKLNGTFQIKNIKNTERSKRKKGGQPNNKNAVGHGAPVGNLNSLKHGAYQTMYVDMLSDEEREIYEQMSADINIDEEIRLLRLKIARLLNRKNTFIYDMFGKKYNKEVSEEDRETGILACMDQLRKALETKATILGDTEKLQLEKEKFEFNKYKTDIELQLKKEKLELEKSKLTQNDDKEDKIDKYFATLEKVFENAE